MSTEIMAWMRIKPKNIIKDGEGFQAWMNLLQYNTIDIPDPRTGATLAYVETIKDEELSSPVAEWEEHQALTLMGYGDSWSFESADDLIALILEHQEVVVKGMLKKEKDRPMLGQLLQVMEEASFASEFSHIVCREEDFDVQGGFDEFVWCRAKGCDFPAEYNAKRLENGVSIGRDDFPASRPLTAEDIPYCEGHYEEWLA